MHSKKIEYLLNPSQSKPTYKRYFSSTSVFFIGLGILLSNGYVLWEAGNLNPVLLGIGFGFSLGALCAYGLFMIRTRESRSAQNKLEDVEGELKYLATHDYLTKLPNRVLLKERYDQALKKVEESKTGIGLMFVDLNGFKKINDEFGHDTGDILLEKIASKLSRVQREGLVVARLGGDEFAVMVENGTTSIQTEVYEILAVFDQPQEICDKKFNIGATIGIKMVNGRQQDLKENLKFADQAMYQARNEGKPYHYA